MTQRASSMSLENKNAVLKKSSNPLLGDRKS
jgi:hypothetical protein